VPDVFLSYARRDLARVRLIADALESHGWSVFWDRNIPPGQDFTRYIQEQLDAAKCVVVAWSRMSVLSHFVRDEAERGRLRLVPLLLDDVQPPLGFGQLQTANLTDWSGDPAHEEFSRLVESVRTIVPKGSAPKRESPRVNLDVYISSAFLDDVPAVGATNGWVTNFARFLNIRSRQLMGTELKMFGRPQPAPDRIPFDELDVEQRFSHVKVFMPIVSANYAESKWARREVEAFYRAAESNGGVQIGDSSRIFKVMKSPVPPADLPLELRSLLGYQFFQLDPNSGEVREFDYDLSRREFALRVDKLAHDLVELLARWPPEGGT